MNGGDPNHLLTGMILQVGASQGSLLKCYFGQGFRIKQTSWQNIWSTIGVIILRGGGVGLSTILKELGPIRILFHGLGQKVVV